ncbi:MAG: long-chain fatty acid--CoA ligase [Armatimonadota bacterium]|nr:long-chain fatty acid--CoA ligase [Armatimonadota bacterium]MCX7777366.1 long-chain fatty acid--CoA ligase [Armatimonadota bacterium]MDW8025366.1 long-chain fatty acid--CoA ligase [Armatimonadota bacterium]
MGCEWYDQKVWLRRYPQGVPSSLQYPEVPLDSILSEASKRYPNKAATLLYGARMSYGELDELATKFAFAVQNIGVGFGERVALMLPNCPQFVIAYYGVVRAGCIVVPLNPLLSWYELNALMKDCGARMIITLDALMDKVSAALHGTAIKHVVASSLASYVPVWLSLPVWLKTRPKGKVELPSDVSVHQFEQLLRVQGKPAPHNINPRDDTAVFQYTGGTTGLPKAAMLTHYNLVVNAHQCSAWATELKDGEETFICVLPFFHSYGMTACLSFGVLKCATLVLAPRFDVAETTKLISRYRVTVFMGVPSMYGAVSYHAQRSNIDITSIKACISGGAPLPKQIAVEFERVTGGKLVEGYGLTEASPVTHINPIWGGEAKIGSIGLPIPDTECRVVDLETGANCVPVGEVGELIIRGPQVMKGYWNRPEETAQTLRDGWLYTGDIAKMDEDGYFYIVDRKKDLIIVEGFNVYPREVEEVLYSHQKVKEAAVVGEKHPVRGEIVKAYVVLREGQDATEIEIIEFCRERLSPYKVPRAVEFVSELPKSAIGKVLRRKLRENQTGE